MIEAIEQTLDDRRAQSRLRKVRRMVRAGDQREQPVSHRLGDTRRVQREADVARARQSEHRHLESRQVVPERTLGPDSAAPKAAGETRCTVREPPTPLRSSITQIGEHRIGQPAVNKGGDVAARVEFVGHRVVASTSCRSRIGVVDASACANEDEASNRRRGFEGRMEGDPASEGVTEEMERFWSRVLEQAGGCAIEIGVARGVRPVTWEVDADQSVPAREGRPKDSPRCRVLGEPVRKDQAGPFAEETWRHVR